MKKKKKKFNPDELRRFFLSCEIKPNSELWSVFDPFAYDVEPAYTHGSLGIIAYEPKMCYSIIDIGDESPPLLGYLMTITHPDTILLLDKLKGYYGYDSFNYHIKRIIHAFTKNDKKPQPAWCYILSDAVLDRYQQIEQVEWGLWDEDAVLISVLESLGGEKMEE